MCNEYRLGNLMIWTVKGAENNRLATHHQPTLSCANKVIIKTLGRACYQEIEEESKQCYTNVTANSSYFSRNDRRKKIDRRMLYIMFPMGGLFGSCHPCAGSACKVTTTGFDSTTILSSVLIQHSAASYQTFEAELSGTRCNVALSTASQQTVQSPKGANYCLTNETSKKVPFFPKHRTAACSSILNFLADKGVNKVGAKLIRFVIASQSFVKFSLYRRSEIERSLAWFSFSLLFRSCQAGSEVLGI